jgi:hypothetical protein
MKTIRVLSWLALLLSLSSQAGASRIATVKDVLDYTDNASGKEYYFWPPTETLDHSPFFRHAWEDWGWTHDLAGRLPSDVNGIQSASLSIKAWDVDVNEGEIDLVTVNNTLLGQLEGMPDEQDRVWTTTTFNLPSNILQELLRDSKIDVFLNIDRYLSGDRVTIASSTLEVNYTAVGDVQEPNVFVYRFWSDKLVSHFYTISEEERDYLIANFAPVWTYEGVAYRAFGAPLDDNLRPIYRFWSESLGAHFYTISDDEKNNLLINYGTTWVYEGVAWYAYPEGLQTPTAKPVYRFRSDLWPEHFYTISEDEKDFLIANFPAPIWIYEGIAWYAYE